MHKRRGNDFIFGENLALWFNVGDKLNLGDLLYTPTIFIAFSLFLSKSFTQKLASNELIWANLFLTAHCCVDKIKSLHLNNKCFIKKTVCESFSKGFIFKVVLQ